MMRQLFMPERRNSSPKPRIGCGFLCVSALLTCILLAINGLIVMNLVNAILPTLPDVWHQPNIAQAIVFLGPVLLLVIEWWACDVALDWLRPMGGPSNDKS